MKVSDLSSIAIADALKCGELRLHFGPFTVCIESTIPAVAEGVSLLYADYPLAATDDFIDFYVSIFQPPGLRRWFKPQILFAQDGHIPFKPLPLSQAFPMLEWGLNWCVSSYANQYLIIHAAVVERGGHALIMPAPPGSGKSTLCAALINRGWRLLSDELALVSPGNLRITPLPRPVSLKNESISIIQAFAPGTAFSRPARDTQKGTVAHMRAPSDSVRRWDKTAKPAWIIYPRYQPDAPARLETLPKAQALLRLAENSFNYSLLGASGFNTAADLVNVSGCYEFAYSNLDEAIGIFNALSASKAADRQRVPVCI